MKRNLVALVVVVAVGIGLVDPYACVQYSSGGSLKRAAPARERARVLAAARRALALLPAPRGHVLDASSITSQSDAEAAWEDGRGGWRAPVAARAERLYYKGETPEGDEGPPSFEQRVFVNSEIALPTGLESEGAPPRDFPMRGAAAVLVTTAGAEESAEGTPSPGGRLALPLPPGRAATAPAIVRVLLADPALERAFREAGATGRLTLPTRRPPARAGTVETLVVELYGGRRDVEAMARRIPVAALRRLLDR
ncbi:MAG: hypothetical protein ACM3PF_07610 [Bacteroidota bacterium]